MSGTELGQKLKHVQLRSGSEINSEHYNFIIMVRIP